MWWGYCFMKLLFQLSVFYHWVHHGVCLYMWTWICRSTFLLYALYWEFIINRCWILSNTFSASSEMIILFLSIIFLVWCSTLTGLLHPRIRIILSIYCAFGFANIFVEDFCVYIQSHWHLSVISFFVCFSVCFWCRVMWALQNRKYSFTL